MLTHLLQCGTCFQVTFQGVSIYFLAIDIAGDGVVLSKSSMDKITGGQSTAKGAVDGTVVQVNGTNCNLPF
jgi:hypothetical protein